MKILIIGAHQNNNGFRCGGHHIMTPAETTARRAKESATVEKLLDMRFQDTLCRSVSAVPGRWRAHRRT